MSRSTPLILASSLDYRLAYIIDIYTDLSVLWVVLMREAVEEGSLVFLAPVLLMCLDLPH